MLGSITESDANYAAYPKHLQKTIDEPFAVFVQG